MARDYYFGTPEDDAERLALVGFTHNGASLANLDRYAGTLSGTHVLDIGGGGGSFAADLLPSVGPHGHVSVSDLAPRAPSILDYRAISYYCSDIEQEVPPGGPYDIVHARMVLSHLADPLRALRNAVSALVPGGVIYIADLDKITSMTLVDVYPFDAARQAILDDIVRSSDYDPYFGRRLPALLQSCDVTNITVNGEVEFHFGGDNRTQLVRHVAAFDRISGRDHPFSVDTLKSVVDDERLISMGSMMVHAFARRSLLDVIPPRR